MSVILSTQDHNMQSSLPSLFTLFLVLLKSPVYPVHFLVGIKYRVPGIVSRNWEFAEFTQVNGRILSTPLRIVLCADKIHLQRKSMQAHRLYFRQECTTSVVL